jgi:hypothetical protein
MLLYLDQKAPCPEIHLKNFRCSSPSLSKALVFHQHIYLYSYVSVN